MIDKTPSSFEYCLIFFSSALELRDNKKIKMNNLIVDAANKKIFLTIIESKNIYSISFENSKTNYERLIVLINDFLKSHNMNINDISRLYVNRGPGSFAGIRNSLAVCKGIHIAKKIDYFCFSFNDFDESNRDNYVNVPTLCDKLKIKKNLIKPIYLS